MSLMDRQDQETDILSHYELDWRVQKLPSFVKLNNHIPTGYYAYVRSDTKEILSHTNIEKAQPYQNRLMWGDFRNFLHERKGYVVAAGSLRDSKLVWMLGSLPIEFNAGRNDPVIANVLLTNYHDATKVPDLRFMPSRGQSYNTLSFQSDDFLLKNFFELSGNEEQVMDKIKSSMANLKNGADILTNVKIGEDLDNYLKKVFPLSGQGKARWSRSVPAQRTLNEYDNFPGHKLADGTWWKAYNAVCYSIDYLLGQSASTRVDSAWYGVNHDRKVMAFKLALKFTKRG